MQLYWKDLGSLRCKSVCLWVNVRVDVFLYVLSLNSLFIAHTHIYLWGCGCSQVSQMAGHVHPRCVLLFLSSWSFMHVCWQTQLLMSCVFNHQCKKKHTLVCPDFSKSGSCPRGSRCKLHHRQRVKRSAGGTSTTPAKKVRTKEPSKRSEMQFFTLPQHRLHVNLLSLKTLLFSLLGPVCLSSCRRMLRHLQGRPLRVLWLCRRSSPSLALQRRQMHRTRCKVTQRKSKVWTLVTLSKTSYHKNQHSWVSVRPSELQNWGCFTVKWEIL